MGEFGDAPGLEELEWAATVIDGAVCWRCMRAEVEEAGDECEECPPEPVPPQLRGLLRGPQGANHPKAVYDPSDRPDPAEMTAEEREAEILLLASTQVTAKPPRQTEWEKRVVLLGGNPRRLAHSEPGVYVRGRLVRRDDGYGTADPARREGRQS